jgi:hypothetical protein
VAFSAVDEPDSVGLTIGGGGSVDTGLVVLLPEAGVAVEGLDEEELDLPLRAQGGRSDCEGSCDPVRGCADFAAAKATATRHRDMAHRAERGVRRIGY